MSGKVVKFEKKNNGKIFQIFENKEIVEIGHNNGKNGQN